MLDILKNSFYYLVSFVCGCVFFYLIDYEYFELSKEVKILEVVTLIVTVSIAFYISERLDRGLATDRFSVELFVAKLNELDLIASKIEQDLIVNEKNDLRKFTSYIHKLRQVNKSINEELESDVRFSKNKELTELVKDLKSKIRDLNRGLTKIPLVNDNDDSIRIKNNIVTYSLLRKYAINSELSAFSNLIFKLKLQINKL